MKKLLSTLALIGATAVALLAAPAVRAEGNFPLDRAPDNTENLVSLQHGAQLFVNYCLNCHGANLMRYNRLTDLGISQKEIERICCSRPTRSGTRCPSRCGPKTRRTGSAPCRPTCLSRSGRAAATGCIRICAVSTATIRGRPAGTTRCSRTSACPCVVAAAGAAHCQIRRQDERGDGEKVHTLVGFQQVTPGTLSSPDYDAAVADLVAYMTWMSEPAQQTRKRLGVWVLIFLGVLTFLAWRLNAAYWKDIK
jgi:ubiquinol-cytochrome c reductase cytochrome c1 subunit